MNILVYGWYNHFNVGDDLFIDAFRKIFPQYSFIFTDQITTNHLDNIDAVFFGGGSFLDGQPNIAEDALGALLSKKVFYIGVGTETEIHPTDLKLMRAAKLIATRSKNFDKIKPINENILFIPDLVYSLQSDVVINNINSKSILYLPNSNLVPKNKDPIWKYNLWEYFKSEFSQAIEYLIGLDYNIDIFSMCQNKYGNDCWAGIEILNKICDTQNINIINNKCNNISYLSNIFSKYEIIISSRFHGIILAEMVGRNCLSISHHDKLNYGKNVICYNSINKNSIIDSFYNLENSPKIHREHYFDLLRSSIDKLI